MTQGMIILIVFVVVAFIWLIINTIRSDIRRDEIQRLRRDLQSHDSMNKALQTDRRHELNILRSEISRNWCMLMRLAKELGYDIKANKEPWSEYILVKKAKEKKS